MENNTIKDDGYFWWRDTPIPEGSVAPESAIAGVLTITTDGKISLELHGYLTSEEDLVPRLFNELGSACPDILGRLKNTSEYVLLSDVYNNGGRAAFGGISFEKYGATSCLIGAQEFPSDREEIQYDSLRIPLTGFEDWLCISSIDTIRTKRKLTSTYKTQKNIQYPLDDGSKLSIEFDLLGPYFGHSNSHSVKITEKIYLKYLTKDKQSSADMQKCFSSISDLFLVLTGSDFSMEWPFITIEGKKNTLRTYKLYFLRSRTSAAPPAHYSSWLIFPHIRENFGQIFQQWQKKRKDLGPGMSLYLGTRRGIQLYVEHRFVNLIWGLESLHRTLNKDAPPTKLEEKVQRIIAQIAATKDKRWLEGKLEHSAEPSLAERLVDCIKKLPLQIAPSEINTFCIECADRRNDISHFGGQRTPGSYDAFLQKIHSLNNALTYLYPAILLKECGFDDKLLNDVFTKGLMAGRIQRILQEVGLQLTSNQAK
ncbi:hypothetical protein HCU66_20570 [Pseudomonas frederiksbergensis]|uniref:ApeA N-terminal domain 1-containing protein n=1 Tax=Pseudomonas frederiksbergensis TaxID=104087 RepID=UPI0019825AAD|nr:HEPN domain-containing protein [Pseudomonas frederiksbergensis]MBN3864629.1 hypothetical protein [Pseudomonas frederiksbergensis]